MSGNTFENAGALNDARIQEDRVITFQYPMLTKTNYATWAIKMHVLISAQGVFEAVEGEGPTDTKKDTLVLAAIYQAINEDMLQLRANKSAKEVWKITKMMNQGDDRIMEVRIQTLMKDFEGLKMKENEIVDDFSSKMNIVVTKLRGLGNQIEEERVVKKFLN